MSHIANGVSDSLWHVVGDVVKVVSRGLQQLCDVGQGLGRLNGQIL